MSWKGTGRSGIGNQAILGDYNDWDGLSMNGRQWKSRLTKETRDLSGADYWHMRKALEPKMLEDIPTFVNGRPNIAAFAEPEQKPKAKKKKSVADSIDLAEKHFQRMEKLSAELDEEYYAGEIDEERYELLRYKLDERLIRAWKRLEKDSLPIWQKEDEKFAKNDLTFSLEDVRFTQEAREHKKNATKSLFYSVKSSEKSLIKGDGWVSMALKGCSNNNVFLTVYCTALNILNKLKGHVNG